MRREDVDQCLVGVESRLVGIRDLGGRLVLETGLDEHRVGAAVDPLVAQMADVGDVLDVEHVDAVVQQRPSDEVREQVAAQVADVGVAVDGRAAGVHPDPPGLDRLDGLDLPGQRVAETEHVGHPRGAWTGVPCYRRVAATASRIAGDRA